MYDDLLKSAKALLAQNNIEGEMAKPKITLFPDDRSGSLDCSVNGKTYSLSLSVDNEGNTEMSYPQDGEPKTAQEETEETQNPEPKKSEKPIETTSIEKSADEMDKSVADMKKPEDKAKSEMPIDEDNTKSKMPTEDAKPEGESKTESDCPPAKITLEPKEKVKSYQPDLSNLYNLYFPNPIK